MNYGHWSNSFWNIFISAYGGGLQRQDMTFDEMVELYTSSGFALWDVLKCATKGKKGSLDGDIIDSKSEYNDVLGFLKAKPSVVRVVLPLSAANKLVKRSNAAFVTALKGPSSIMRFAILKDNEEETFKKTMRVFGLPSFKNVSVMTPAEMGAQQQTYRLVELVVVPSTSPAAAEGRGFQKEKAWFAGAFRLEGVPTNYTCACCGETGDHLLADCGSRTEAWRQAQKGTNRKQREAWSAWEVRGGAGPEPLFKGYCWAI